MGFADAVKKTPEGAVAYRKGLQALRKSDKAKISCENAQGLTGSVNLEDAIRDSRPNENIWDYAIGFRPKNSPEKVYWLEIHPAFPKNVKEVVDKLVWLKKWLQNAPALNGLPKEFVWVASGKTSLLSNSPERRRIAKAGIRFDGRQLVLK
jgi:hypothetical protein